MHILTCHIDRTSEIPIYEQLYFYIKKEITAGRLIYGTKLPSKRKLAEFLKISQNTVESAYAQLTAEGYVEALPRKGYFVMASEDLEYVQAVNYTVNKAKKEQEKIKYHFHPGQIDTINFPFSQWRKYAKNTIDKEQHTLLQLGDAQGEYELRQEISTYLYQARGAKCSPEQIIIGAGSEPLLQQLLLLFAEDTIYGVEDPGYHLIHRLLMGYKKQVYPLEVDHEGVKVDTIEQSDLNVVYVTPSHHFPYGTVLSVNRRTQLLNWAARENNRFIIEDDYDSEFRYSGKTIPSLQSMDQNERVIYLGSFSKSLMPSVRISYLVLPKQLLQRYKEELPFFHSSVSRIDQVILTEFMKQGDFEKHLNRMRKIYRRKLEKIIELLKPHQEKLRIIGEQSGLHIVIAVENGMNEAQLVEKALAVKLKIYPLSSYTMKNKYDYQPKIILGFAGIQEEELEIALQLLLKSWGM